MVTKYDHGAFGYFLQVENCSSKTKMGPQNIKYFQKNSLFWTIDRKHNRRIINNKHRNNETLVK